jgi:hypothetical protein
MELGQFDETENKYREASTGMLHTRERCEAMKNTMRNNSKPAMEEQQPQKQPAEPKEQQPPTLDQIDLRLKRVEAMLFNQGT